MPIGLLRTPEAGFLAGLLLVTALLGTSAITVFYKGLARYSSGNRIGMKS
jgi:ABC-2 type transport system permease protein